MPADNHTHTHTQRERERERESRDQLVYPQAYPYMRCSAYSYPDVCPRFACWMSGIKKDQLLFSGCFLCLRCAGIDLWERGSRKGATATNLFLHSCYFHLDAGISTICAVSSKVNGKNIFSIHFVGMGQLPGGRRFFANRNKIRPKQVPGFVFGWW